MERIHINNQFYLCPACPFRTQFPSHKLLDHLRSHDALTVSVTPEDFVCENCRKPIGCTHAVLAICQSSCICRNNSYCQCDERTPRPLDDDQLAADAGYDEMDEVEEPENVEFDAPSLTVICGDDGVLRVKSPVSSSESDEDDDKEHLQPTIDFFRVKDESLPYHCYFCDFTCADPNDINQHVTSDHVEKCKYSCKYCSDFDAKRKAKWALHMTSAHQICAHILDQVQPRNPLVCVKVGNRKKKDTNIVYAYAGLTISKDRNLTLCNSCSLKFQSLRKHKKTRKKKRSLSSALVSTHTVSIVDCE